MLPNLTIDNQRIDTNVNFVLPNLQIELCIIYPASAFHWKRIY